MSMRTRTRIAVAALLLTLLLGATSYAQCTSNCAGIVTAKPTGDASADGLWKSPNAWLDRTISGQYFLGSPVVTFSLYRGPNVSGAYPHLPEGTGAAELSDATKTTWRNLLQHFGYFTANIVFIEVQEPGAVGQVRLLKSSTIQSQPRALTQFPLFNDNGLGILADIVLNSTYDDPAYLGTIDSWSYGPNSYSCTNSDMRSGSTIPASAGWQAGRSRTGTWTRTTRC